MNIGLIDADLLDKGTRFPNLALMKISGYYQNEGYTTKLINYQDIGSYDKVFISKVFSNTNIPVNLDFYSNVEKGGTGFDFDKDKTLPDDIEHSMPDYKLYKEYTDISEYYSKHSIGFTTRYCFRGCSFCVNRNKKKVVRWSPISEFHHKHNKYITLLDDNILGHKDRVDILKELQILNIPFEYKQGLDLRLMNDEIAYILNNSKYAGEFIFAFDSIEDKKIILDKLKLWKKYNKTRNKFYVLCSYDNKNKYSDDFWINDIINTFERIKILSKEECLPYVMKYKKYEESPFRGMYINIAGWCNQPWLFKKMTFRQYSIKKSPGGSSERYMRNFEAEYPNIAKEYFDMKYEDLIKTD
ncbi:MAG: hypothetical protein ACLFMO_08430 [Eubacteriales bacterium]